jgi:signal transduction histidine kinase
MPLFLCSASKLVAARMQPGSRDAENLELVLEGGRRAQQLVQQILDFGRKEPPSRRALRLNEVVEHSLTMLRASLSAKIRIEQHLQIVPPIMGTATSSIRSYST